MHQTCVKPTRSSEEISLCHVKYLKTLHFTNTIKRIWQNIDKVFKHKELQQQLMDTKLQRITDMMKEVEEKQQRERDFVSVSIIWCPEKNAGCQLNYMNTENITCATCNIGLLCYYVQLLNEATESRRKCDLMKEQETQLKQQVR